MTKHIAILLLILSTASSFAQNTFNQMHPISIAQPPFNYTAQGSFFDAFEIDESPNYFDGFLLFGRGVVRNPGLTDNTRRGIVAKVNTNGDLMYMREYNDIDTTMETSFGSAFYSSAVQDHNENYRAIMTITDGFASFRRYMLTTDLFGDPIDLVLIDSVYSNDRHFTSFFDHRDSTIVIGLGINPENWDPGLLDFSILWKLDTLGNTIWKRDYEACYLINSIQPNPSGGYVVGGSNNIDYCDDFTNWDSDKVVIRVDGDGEEEARWSHNGYCNGEIIYSIPIENDQIVIIGKINPEEYDGIAPWTGDIYSSILQYENGQLIEVGEQKIYYRESAPVIPMQAKKLSDGSGYMFTGSGSFTEYDQLVGYLAKIDNNRDSVWFRAYVYFEPLENSWGNGWHYLNSFKETSDGGFVAVGYIQQRGNNPNPLLDSPWIVKVDEYGCIEPGCHLVNVEEIVIGLENTMSAFPNPASDHVTIQFTHPEGSSLDDLLQNGELIFFDTQGREVYRTNTRSAGFGGQITIDINHLPAGLYSAQWVSGKQWLDSTKILVTND
jgi:hypothetical protein